MLLLLFIVLEETRKETPKLVFKDQNLESARNLLRQSLRRRLQSMDRADGQRRSMKARSLQRQCMLEAVSSNTKQGNARSSKTLGQITPMRPTRPAPLPPTNKNDRTKNKNFTDVQIVPGSSSTNIDLSHSLNGPNVHFESASLIQTQANKPRKPTLPPKPKYLKVNQPGDHRIRLNTDASIPSTSTNILNDDLAQSNQIPMKDLNVTMNGVDLIEADEGDSMR